MMLSPLIYKKTYELQSDLGAEVSIIEPKS